MGRAPGIPAWVSARHSPSAFPHRDPTGHGCPLESLHGGSARHSPPNIPAWESHKSPSPLTSPCPTGTIAPQHPPRWVLWGMPHSASYKAVPCVRCPPDVLTPFLGEGPTEHAPLCVPFGIGVPLPTGLGCRAGCRMGFRVQRGKGRQQSGGRGAARSMLSLSLLPSSFFLPEAIKPV